MQSPRALEFAKYFLVRFMQRAHFLIFCSDGDPDSLPWVQCEETLSNDQNGCDSHSCTLAQIVCSETEREKKESCNCYQKVRLFVNQEEY